MEAGEPACRKIVEHPRRRQDEEIDPHRIPVELAQADDRDFDRLPGQQEQQAVADLQMQHFRQPVLDRGQSLSGFAGGEPASGAEGVARRQFGAVGEVEFALDHPPRLFILIIGRADRPPVHRFQAGADHRREFRLQTVVGKKAAHFAQLFGLDVDHEAIRRIRWNGTLPGL